jgi:hypothetical protein
MRGNRKWTGLMPFAVMAAVALAVAPACNSDLASIGQHCSLNSDCDSPLICVFTVCHEACATSVDCPMGERCVPSGSGDAGDPSPDGGEDHVCQLPAESTCAVSPCNSGEVCGADKECRAPCTMSGTCVGGDTCETVDEVRACYDPENPVDQGAILEIILHAPGLALPDAAVGETTGDGSPVADGRSPVGDGSTDATVSEGAPAADGQTDSGVHDATVDATTSDGPPVADGGSPVADGQADVFERNPDDGILGFIVSNVDLGSVDAGLAGDSGPFANAQDVSVSGSGNYCSTAGGCVNMTPAPIPITLNNGTYADLYVWNSFSLAQTSSLTFTDTNPVIVAVLTTASIQGPIYVNDGNAGGFFSPSSPGPGSGLGGVAQSTGFGGGSFCGVGGSGGVSTGSVPAGGATYGTANLIPLVAGSGGGGPGYAGAYAAGGGAIQIVAGQSITVGPYGSINAGGRGSGYNGGGSGGAILLEAPTVVVQGALAANGGGGSSGQLSLVPGAAGNPSDEPALGGEDSNVDGGVSTGGNGSAGTVLNGTNGGPPEEGYWGGSGGGGAGRIRINTATGFANIVTGSIISPDPSTLCMTQGTLSQ